MKLEGDVADRPRASDALPPPRLPEGWEPPEPQPLSVPEGEVGSVLTGSLALALRLASGVFVVGWKPEAFGESPQDKYSLFGFRDGSSVLQSCPRPAEPIRIYEYEPSPYSRKVREACSMLDLEVTYLPCPGARAGFAAELGDLGGKMQVPCMVDPNGDGAAMYESDDIIDYLFDRYGPGKDAVPWLLKGPFALWTCAFASFARGLAGNRLAPNARPDNTRMQPLKLWGYEGSPFVKPVREALCGLGLPHTMVNSARGSANRDRMVAATGRFQVPYLEDPNTGAQLFESAGIVKYLESVYTV
jgi:glutathione S-transferase